MHVGRVIFGFGFVDLLGDLELAPSDEVDAINLGGTFHIHFLTSDELFWPHILINFLDDIGPEG